MTTPLLLLHGALATKEQFANLRPHLLSDFHIHSLDFEGHGSRFSDNAYSIELFTDNVIEYLEQHQLEKVDIFGYSMGGYVAIHLAKKYPNLVNRIMTLGTKFDWSPETAAKEIKMLNSDLIESKVPHFAVFLEKTHKINGWKNVLSKTSKMMIRLGNENIIHEEHYKNINHKVNICVGDGDTMAGIEPSKIIAKLLPNSTFTIIPDSPHFIEKYDQEKLASIVKSFFISPES